MGTIKILERSDGHVDRTSNEAGIVSGIDHEKGIYANWIESFRMQKEIIDIANREEVDYIIDGGDIFDTGMPRPEAVKRYTDLHRQELNPHTKVVIAGGNHDFLKITHGFATPIDAYLSNEPWVLGVSTETKLIHGDGIDFALIPWYRVSNSKVVDDISSKMEDDIKRLADTASNVSIAFGHFTLSEMPFSSEYRGAERSLGISSIEASVSQDVLDDGPWSTWSVGHNHREQIIKGTKGKVIGSPYRITYKEAEERKGVWLTELDEHTGLVVRSEFIELSARYLHSFDLSGDNDLTTDMMDMIGERDVVRFIFDADQRLTPAQSRRIEKLSRMGVMIQETRLPRARVQTAHNRSLSLSTSPVDALNAHIDLTLKEEHPELVKPVLDIFGDILNEAGDI